MAQTGFTPIQLYRTSTASAVPTAGNLADGELALNFNTADGKLYYKDSAGVVQLLASKANAGTIPVTSGGTGLTTLTANNVILGNGTSNPLFVAPGTSGNVLTSNGTTWASTAAATPGWVLLSVVTASGAATADVETTFDSTYDSYAIVVSGCYPSTATQPLLIRLKVSGAYGTSNYFYHSNTSTANSTAYTSVASVSAAQINTTGSVLANSSTTPVQGIVWISTPTQSNTQQISWEGSAWNETGYPQVWAGIAAYGGSAGALTGVRFFMNSGNINGTFRLFGIRKT